ncbi:MAG: flagellar basal-body rod protein FlgF [Desulfuromonadaceae bacterium GWB2_53_15]|nr:MAG: flagellar basal-body rod protein FlgF [Desulfuromonadales bacterium GWD2_54_10]OHB32232.1 MAG: flagellar basal-body rod protein FlgF [Desulfuromonadaceae bacterium GWB2_53_15]
MNSGMYSALSGNIAAMKRLDIISNNLANVNTPGFKKDKMGFESLLAGAVNPPAVPQGSTADPILQKENIFIDYAQGPVAQTGNVFDLSIDGDGFFVVNTPEGQAYTRQGNFRMSADGTLVTVDGFPVMGQNGAIRIQGSNVEIDAKGVVTVDGNPAGTLNIVDFPKPYNLSKTAGALFTPADPQVTPQAAKGELRQGYLEGSNVETISEMVQMIETSRYFEACSKVIKGFDDIAAKAASEIGRL